MSVIDRVLSRAARSPIPAHLWRAYSRYMNRLGNQFAGGITYYSILAVVPILMFGFSSLGWTLTVFRPEWLSQIKNVLNSQLASPAAGDQVAQWIDKYLNDWRAIGLFGVVSALWAGSGWMGSLKGAVRALWRPEVDITEQGRNPIAEWFVNLVLMLGTLIVVFITFVTNAAGSWLAERIPIWAGLENPDAVSLWLRVVSLAVSLATGWAFFALLYWVLPQHKTAWRPLALGALGASLSLTLLQMGAGQLIELFARNRAFIIFGPVITLMLFLNLFARLNLFIAAWIATANQPAIARVYNPSDAPLYGKASTLTVPGHWEAADRDRRERDRQERDIQERDRRERERQERDRRERERRKRDRRERDRQERDGAAEDTASG